MCPFSKLWLWPRAAALCRWLQALWHEDLLEASFADEAGLGRAPHRLERGLAATRYRKMPRGWLVWLCLGLAGTSPQSFELRGKVWCGFPRWSKVAVVTGGTVRHVVAGVVCVVARLLRSSAPGKHLMEYNPLESAPESKEFNESRFQEIRQLDAPWILEMEWRSRERTVLLYYANLCHIYASQSLEAWLTSHLEVDQPAGCHGFGAPCVVIDSSPLVRGEMAPKVCSRDAAELHSLNKVNAGARFQRLCICRAMRFGQGMTRMSSKFYHSHPFAPLRHHFARRGQLSPAAGARILADSGEQMRKSEKQWKTYAWKHWTYRRAETIAMDDTYLYMFLASSCTVLPFFACVLFFVLVDHRSLQEYQLTFHTMKRRHFNRVLFYLHSVCFTIVLTMTSRCIRIQKNIDNVLTHYCTPFRVKSTGNVLFSSVIEANWWTVDNGNIQEYTRIYKNTQEYTVKFNEFFKMTGDSADHEASSVSSWIRQE